MSMLFEQWKVYVWPLVNVDLKSVFLIVEKIIKQLNFQHKQILRAGSEHNSSELERSVKEAWRGQSKMKWVYDSFSDQP